MLTVIIFFVVPGTQGGPPRRGSAGYGSAREVVCGCQMCAGLDIHAVALSVFRTSVYWEVRAYQRDASYPSWERVALPFTPVGKTHDCPLYRWPRQLGAAGEVRFAEFLFL